MLEGQDIGLIMALSKAQSNKCASESLSKSNYHIVMKGNTKYSKNNILSDVWQEGNKLVSVGSQADSIKVKIGSENIVIPTVLRKLSDTVYDEIVGNKLIKRVGQIVLNGSENWTGGLKAGAAYYLYSSSVLAKPNTGSGTAIVSKSDTLKPISRIDIDTGITGVGVGYTGAFIIISNILKSVSELKIWLKANPTTILFELETPVTTDFNNNFMVMGEGSISVDDIVQPSEMKSYTDLSVKQDKTDNTLKTIDKTIVGAINELFAMINK